MKERRRSLCLGASEKLCHIFIGTLTLPVLSDGRLYQLCFSKFLDSY